MILSICFPAPCICLLILCAELCVPGQSSYTYIFMVYHEGRVGVLCSMYDMLHTDAKCYTIMCTFIRLRKTLSLITLQRISDKVDDFLTISQSGFPRGWSIADVIWGDIGGSSLSADDTST